MYVLQCHHAVACVKAGGPYFADGDELDLHSPLIARKYNQTPVIFSEVYIPLYVQSFLIVLCRGVDRCRMCSLVFFAASLAKQIFQVVPSH